MDALNSLPFLIISLIIFVVIVLYIGSWVLFCVATHIAIDLGRAITIEIAIEKGSK